MSGKPPRPCKRCNDTAVTPPSQYCSECWMKYGVSRKLWVLSARTETYTVMPGMSDAHRRRVVNETTPGDVVDIVPVDPVATDVSTTDQASSATD